jgi:hypothetical protein
VGTETFNSLKIETYLNESHFVCVCDCLNLSDQVMLLEAERKSFIPSTGRLEEQGSLGGAVVEGSGRGLLEPGPIQCAPLLAAHADKKYQTQTLKTTFYATRGAKSLGCRVVLSRKKWLHPHNWVTFIQLH